MNKINHNIKNIKFIILTLLPAAAMMIFFSCKANEPEPDYTYSIFNVWWSDSLDGNQDGYIQFARLNFDVRLLEDVQRPVSARVYYKRSDASEFSFYAFADDAMIDGKNRENFIFVPIGKPNKELKRSEYDFSIEIYEKGKDNLEAKSGKRDSLILFNQKFEESTADKSFSLDVWWSDQFDRNQNGYWRYATLNINADVDDDVERDMDAVLYYKSADDTEYSIYHEFNNFRITGQSDTDFVSVLVGVGNEPLDYGEYDFKINLFEHESDILAAFSDEADNDLNNQKFESEDADSYYYTIDNVWWSDSIDLDGDTYTSFRNLHFDVNVDKDEQRTIFAKIFTRSPDTTDYSKYDSTANFNIFGGNSADVYTVPIGLRTDSLALDSNKYDFLITVYEAFLPDSEQTVEAAISAFTDSTLSEQKFEMTAQDTL